MSTFNSNSQGVTRRTQLDSNRNSMLHRNSIIANTIKERRSTSRNTINTPIVAKDESN